MPISISPRFCLGLAASCLLTTSTVTLAAPPYEEWGTPINANNMPGSAPDVNSGAIDGCVSLSRDGLELYLTSFRDGLADIYVAARSDTSQGFGSPQKLPGTVNTPGANEACPTIIGRNTLHFLRSSPGDPGSLYVSRRTSGDWQTAVPFLPQYNTNALEESVGIFEDEEGREVVIFSRRNNDGSGGEILQSVDGGAPVPVAGGPNAAGANNRPWVSRNGLVIAFDSTRPGGVGAVDIWFAERDSTSEPFGEAYNIPEINSPAIDLRPAISWDGTQMFFSSWRPGAVYPGAGPLFPDIWYAERERRRGPKMIEFPSGD
ncbi:hypothetical protein P7228_08305 [Altererythrobacter arenosus]|uniref:Uncharacterized protein n=1 Tax=Altererythrobacter arenosus TaxID=3032592 RepID=A0ABY8FLY0_9SPHN|nr:hypothetical protein [Altererythrobacter sp. CAU 1644]WFL76013.1 hypothetical protein P7228_08305 [Altererythrobacter sp. CAU 1644]